MRDKRMIGPGGDGEVQRRTQLGKKHKPFYVSLIVLLMFINIILFLDARIQIHDIQCTLTQVLNRLESYQSADVAVLSDEQGEAAEFVAAAGLGVAGNSGVVAGIEENDSPKTEDVKDVGTVDSDFGDDSSDGTTGTKTLWDGDISEETEVDYVSLCGLSEVAAPVRLNRTQALARLKELGEENEMIADIYDNHRFYPDNLLGALANNPEMTDFVAGYLNSEVKAKGGGLTEAEKEQDYPLFLQWDPRWGYEEYGDSSIVGLAGCGPVCLSLALYYLLDDESLTPDVLAEYSMKNGYYVSGTGTAWALLTDVPAKYGVEVTQPGVSEETIKKALDQGSVIICSMRPGDFTARGHFIVIYGYDKEGFMVNDPNCVARSKEQWLFSEIGKQIKHIWVLGEKKLDMEIRGEYYEK